MGGMGAECEVQVYPGGALRFCNRVLWFVLKSSTFVIVTNKRVIVTDQALISLDFGKRLLWDACDHQPEFRCCRRCCKLGYGFSRKIRYLTDGERRQHPKSCIAELPGSDEVEMPHLPNHHFPILPDHDSKLSMVARIGGVQSNGDQCPKNLSLLNQTTYASEDRLLDRICIFDDSPQGAGQTFECVIVDSDHGAWEN